jgi:hypothetical protein
VRDLRHADIGVSKQGPRRFKVVFRQLRRTATRAAYAPGSGEACLGALSDQTPLEFC